MPGLSKIIRIRGSTRVSTRGRVSVVGAHWRASKPTVMRGIGHGANSTHFGKLTSGHVGDMGERLFEARVAPRVPMFRRAVRLSSVVKTGGGRGTRTAPLDFRVGRMGLEVKTLNSTGKSLKTAMKASEIKRKHDAARSLGLTRLMTVAQVVNTRAGTVAVYSMPGIRSISVHSMHHVGTFRTGRLR